MSVPRFHRLLLFTLPLVFAGACAESPFTPEREAPFPEPGFEIHDAAHTDEGWHFYFLPPMTLGGTPFSGTFDGALAPVVTICEGEVTDCSAPLATFTMTTGPGAETVRVVPEDEHYIVNWITADFELSTGATYRVVVTVQDLVLGWADVVVLATASELSTVDRDEYVPVVDGSTLPITFRIEEGIVASITVEPAEATIAVGGTQAFTTTLRDLHGDVLTGPAVGWASNPTTVATIDASGTATGVGAGTATITASSQRVSGSATLTVTGAALGAGLDLNGDGMADLLASGKTTSSFTKDAHYHLNTGSGLPTSPSGSVSSPSFFGFPTNGWNMGDLDGDGPMDVALANSATNTVYLYRGATTGLSSSPYHTLFGPNAFGGCTIWSRAGTCFGAGVGTGDVDGDGVTDLIVTAKEYLYVYGGSSGIAGPTFSTSPTQTLRDPFFQTFGDDEYGLALAVGDFDGDGLTDVAVSAERAGFGGNGVVYLYPGSSGGLSRVPLSLGAPTTECSFFCGFGASLAADDFDGDGMDDLAVGAPRASFGSGVVFIYAGSTTGIATTPSATVTGSSNLGTRVAAIGDFDGDGYRDLAASGTQTEISILGGSASGVTGVAAVLQGPGSHVRFGEVTPQFVVGIGDVNRDGRADLATSQSMLDADLDFTREGALWIYHGGTGSRTVPDAELTAAATEYGLIEGVGYNPGL